MAIWPEATLWLAVPVTEAEKSNPMPESVTPAGADMSGELMLSEPVTAPLEVGLNAIATEQLAPAAKAPVQSFWLMMNGPFTEKARSLTKNPLPLLMDTVFAALVCPTGTVAKLSCVGEGVTPVAICPLPFK